MSKPLPMHAATLAQSGTLILLLGLLFLLDRGAHLLHGGFAFALLMAYHLATDRRYTLEQIRGAGLIVLHIAIYLLLCSLVIWVTAGEEESPFWLIYLLPIIVASTNLGLRGMLLTCSAATVLLIGFTPPGVFLDPREWDEGIIELIISCLMLFIVGLLVQTFTVQNRRQLALQKELNEKLLANEASLRESLERLEMAEESLRRQDRLAALGEMSAGIAHEIRNPLGIISSSVQLLDRKIPGHAGARQLLDIIQEETTRLNGLITDFLAFGRPPAPNLQRLDLGGIVLRAVEHLHGLAEQKGVAVKADLPGSAVFVSADPELIQQMLLNLLLNALEATPAGGEVRIRLKAKDGSCLLEVADSGCGIPEENLSRIFNPFFTTKEKGTGLGLANAHKIAENHQGDIFVRSAPGEGAVFSVRLPAGEAF